nr:BatD family protein [Dyella sp. 2HG41-7]
MLPWNAMAATAKAALDRNDVHLGETVTLNLTIDGAMGASTPDLSVLDQDFQVLGTSSNSTLSVVNGRQSAQFVIGIALRPKHVGDVQIPSLTVGGSQTQPLTLHVGAPDTSTSSNTNKQVFIDVSASSNHAYVGQQLLYTVRLFFDVNLNSGSLSDPHADGVDLRKLGNDIDYQTVRSGRRYQVIERHYALTPQHAGSVAIPPVEFQGEVADSGNPNDPGNFFGPGGLFGNSSPVTADSLQLSIDVQAPPADWGNTNWLPARSLTLELQGMPSDDKVTAGQPLNLHMVVKAQGLPGDALPDPSLSTIDGATVYPDKVVTNTHDDGEWLTGDRERSFAIFPQHPGTLTIPEITLTWFDVQTGQKRVASVPSRTLTVLAASGTPATSPTTATSISASGATNAAASAPTSAAATTTSTTPWRWIALVSIALWLISMVVFGWLYARRRSGHVVVVEAKHDDSIKRLRHAFLDAARGDDRSTQARRLLAWARSERPAMRNLGQVADALASDEQRAAIDLLQRQQYADVSSEQRVDLATLFAHGFAWRRDDAAESDSPLPPLYPFKLD